MGQTTTIRTVSIDQAKSGWDALTFAVRDWQASEAPRYAAERANTVIEYPLMTEDTAYASVDTEQFPVFSSQAAAIRICSDDDSVIKTSKMRLTVDAVLLSDLRTSSQDFRLLELARTVFGNAVTNVSAVTLPRARKAVAAATEGKSVTRYELVEGRTRIPATTYDTKAAARTAAINLIDSGTRYRRIAVRAVVQRETGNGDLVVIERPEAELTEITVNVTMSVPKAGAVQSGWTVGFSCHT